MPNENRKYFRVKVKQLTSIVRIADGSYELVKKSNKALQARIDIKDISTGGLRIESVKEEFLKGASCDILLPKLKHLDSKTLKCEVTRVEYEDGDYVHDVGLRFIPPNTEYLKQFLEIIKSY
jgi:hypothetical protein